MEITVALEEWLKRFPRFTLQDGARIVWSKGPVRGPRTVPVRLG
jgi:cytochrome P450